MGIEVSIDITFARNYRPIDTLTKLLGNGWTYCYEGKVNFLRPDDIDDFDWRSVSIDDFDLNRFLDSHKENERVSITLVNSHGIGGDFLIYKNILIMMVSVNRVYLSAEQRIIDFSRYLKYFLPFISLIEVSDIKCFNIF